MHNLRFYGLLFIAKSDVSFFILYLKKEFWNWTRELERFSKGKCFVLADMTFDDQQIFY